MSHIRQSFKLTCVLFDLDGTLLDTAPDLLLSLNKALQAHGLKLSAEATLKPFISHGAHAMIKAAHPDLEPDHHAKILETMLDYYQHHLADHTTLFAGMAETLASIEAIGLKWGVVTNKRSAFTEPLLAALNLSSRAACIVSGDTTSHPKPHAEPMLEACKQARVEPGQCAFIGDARHDILAGRAVQMKTLVAGYGYLAPADQPETWGADALIDSPQQLTQWISACH